MDASRQFLKTKLKMKTVRPDVRALLTVLYNLHSPPYQPPALIQNEHQWTINLLPFGSADGQSVIINGRITSQMRIWLDGNSSGQQVIDDVFTKLASACENWQVLADSPQFEKLKTIPDIFKDDDMANASQYHHLAYPGNRTSGVKFVFTGDG